MSLYYLYKGVLMRGERIDRDYTLLPVPMAARLSAIATILIWSSLTLDPSAPYLAMWWASLYSLSTLIVAVLIANFILSIFSTLSGYIATKTGLTYALSTGVVYGEKGAIVPSMWSGFVAVGWLAFSIGVVVDTLISTLNLPQNSYYFLVPLLLALYTITAFKGITCILRLAKIGVPMLALLIALSIVLAIRSYGMPNLGVVNMSQLPLVIMLVIGTFVNGSIVLSFDYQRFCRTPTDSVITAFTNFLGFWSFIIILTAIPAALVGKDLISTLNALGLGVLASVTLFLLAWTSTDNQLYSASLSWTYGLSRLGMTVSRQKVVIIASAITVVLALLRIHDYALQWLSLLTVVSLPAGIVLWTDYYIVRRGVWTGTSTLRVRPFISWALGSLAIYLTLGKWYSLPLGFIVTILSYIAMKGMRIERRG